MCVEDIKQDRALVNVLDVLNLLSDVLRSRTDTTDRQEDVILEEVLSKHLNVAREGGRKHESLAVLNARHILALNNTTNLGLETHVQHAVSLVKNQILDVAQRDTTTLYEIDQSARSGDQQVAAAFDLAKLGSYLSTTVDNAWTNPGAVGELAGLVINLRDKFTSGSKDQSRRVRLTLTAVAAALTSGNRRGTMSEGLRQNGEQKTTSLAGTRLGASHKIATSDDNRNRILLDWSRNLVAGKLDVAEQVGVERGSAKRQDRLGRVASGRSDRNVVILLKVDSSVLLRRVVGSSKELALQTRVRRADNMLAIAPLTVSRASGIPAAATTTTTSSSSSATTTGRTNVHVAAVGIGVEATLGTAAPSALRGTLLRRAVVTTRAIVPVSATTSIVVIVARGDSG